MVVPAGHTTGRVLLPDHPSRVAATCVLAVNSTLLQGPLPMLVLAQARVSMPAHVSACMRLQGGRGGGDAMASVVPVRLRGGVVALESSFRGGTRRELLRSLCQVSAAVSCNAIDSSQCRSFCAADPPKCQHAWPSAAKCIMRGDSIYACQHCDAVLAVQAPLCHHLVLSCWHG